MAEVANAKVFSKCDVRNGFWHVELDDESSRLTTFSTPFGRYRWKRMPFGIAPASELFQRKLEQQLEGLAGVKNIHDDILVFGEENTVAEAISNHDERMCKLLQCCEARNIALNSGESKFILKEEQLPYMGHIFPRMVFAQIQLRFRQSLTCHRPMGLRPQGDFLEWLIIWPSLFPLFLTYGIRCNKQSARKSGTGTNPVTEP